jgi:hypothetical protein
MENVETGMWTIPIGCLLLHLPLALLGRLHGIAQRGRRILRLHLLVDLHHVLVPGARALAQLTRPLALAALLFTLLLALLLTSGFDHFYRNNRKNAPIREGVEEGVKGMEGRTERRMGREAQGPAGHLLLHETGQTIRQMCIDSPWNDCNGYK